MDKRKHYEVLLDKMKSAHDQEFYLEASWISYSILEDRLHSALKQTGGDTYQNGDKIRMLGQKIEELKHRKSGDNLLAAYFKDELMVDLYNWKEIRNILMHAMADSTKTIDELRKETYLLSQNANKIVKDTCDAAALLKKHRDKA